MKAAKRRSLEKKGWKVGCAAELLSLSPEEADYIEMKLALSGALRELRERSKITQSELARRLGSSQSRVAKIESCDPSVSLDLLVRALLALGARPAAIAKTIRSAKP